MIMALVSGCQAKVEVVSDSAMDDAQPIVIWDFEKLVIPVEHFNDCSGEIRDGILNVSIKGGDVNLVFPKIDVSGPARVQFRMRSGQGTFGQAEVYWRSDPKQGWLESRMVTHALVHDGQWHDYDIGLPSLGPIHQIRIDPGWKPGQVQFDYIRIVKDTVPEEVAEKMKQVPETIELADEVLAVRFESKDVSFNITDKRTKRRWVSNVPEQKAVLVSAVKKGSRSMILGFYDVSTKVAYTCTVMLDDGGVLSFEVDGDAYQQRFHGLNMFPPKLQTDFEHGKLIFCNRSSGMYLDQTDDYEDWKRMGVYCNLSLDMPWIGVLDERTGEGLMLMVETPYDAFVVLEKDEQARNWPQILWRQSMDSFRYSRRASYRFSPSGGYVSLANMYREIARDNGLLVTLEEKAKRKPHVNLLKGAPMIWGGVDAWDFVRQGRARGILKGVISNAHHGLRDRTTIPKINELGYITNEYENISDILAGPIGFETDNVEEAAYHMRPELGPATGWLTSGGLQYYSRSSSMAMRAMKKYVPERLSHYGFNGRFVDVSAALDLFEDYHPDHTFDRRQDLAYRRAAYKYLDDLGLVVGTEHGNDWVNDLLEYCEGAAGGPLWWKGGWNAGELKKPTDREQFNPDYLKYGMGYDVSIPLWQLVHHDCIVSTWYWGDGAGFMYEAAPELSDRKDLFNILYGTVPIFWRDNWGYDWQKNRSRFLQTYHDTFKLNEAVAFDRLLNHEFLSADKSLQRTTFSSGTVCVVNFSDTVVSYQIPGGEKVKLAPRGFYVKGPGIFQSKELIDGNPVTKIKSDQYLRVQTTTKQAVESVELNGTMTAFELQKGRWHILLENTQECVIDLQKLVGISEGQPYMIYEVDSMGCLSRQADYQIKNGRTVLRPKRDEAIYAVLFDDVNTKIVMIPSRADIASQEQIEIASFASDSEIRYTLDGSEPTVSSKKYVEPFAIESSAVLKARAFGADGKAVGNVVEKAYRVTDILFESNVLKGKQPAIDLDLDMTGYKGLILSLDQNGTVVFWDYVDWVDAKLVKSSNKTVELTSQKPSALYHDHYHFGVNERSRNLDKHESLPLMLDGKEYKSGLGMVAPGRAEFMFDEAFDRFQCKVGIDDSYEHKGEVIVRVYGIR
jgi:hypothetical protein